MTNPANALTNLGRVETEIPVTISYRIIELFSAGLYSSPNKAIEELVANSYDAMATHVHAVIPTNVSSRDATIWVADDGIGMDREGLFELWRIAESNKRDPARESKTRRPIGRFGIGKLASYVLARQLTHISKAKGRYRAVTMDYGRVDQSKSADASVLHLPVRVLTEPEARTLLSPLVAAMGDAGEVLRLFGRDAAKAWTVAAMSDFKPLALQLKQGQLRWVLSTALPMNPAFRLYFNGTELESSKEKQQPLKVWRIGVDDGAAEKMGYTTLSPQGGVEIPGLGTVNGFAQLYPDLLTTGKSETWGRSHGIFVTVRGRLINIDDPLFGLPALSHGPFARFRMQINADGLDEYLRATREAVIETAAVAELRKYIWAVFNEARAFYLNWLGSREQDLRVGQRIGGTPQSLSRRPLVAAIRDVLDGKLDRLYLTQVPEGLPRNERASLISRLESDLDSEAGLIREVRIDALGVDRPLAIFDAVKNTVFVNALHPFFLNYSEQFTSTEAFELLAVSEILTEAYLLEQEIDPDDVREVLVRRDRFLRELVYSRRLAAPLVAQLLSDSRSEPQGLEKAVAAALSSLGLRVTEISGKGEPDGLAYADVGVRDEATGERADYTVCYDAKSTGKPRVKAKDLNIAGAVRHRNKYKAQYSLIVAPGFEGEDSEDAAALEYAREHAVTLVAIDDLIKLILVASTHQFGFQDLRQWLESCRTPAESKAWIEHAHRREQKEWPVPELLDAVWKLQRDREERDPVKFASVRFATPQVRKYREREVRDWLTSLQRLAGSYITIEGDKVWLEAPPERILREVRGLKQQLPPDYRPAEMIRRLEPDRSTKPKKKFKKGAKKKR